MAGTLVIGCGGPGRNSVSRLAADGYRCMTIDWSDADLVLLPPGMSEDDAKMDPRIAEELVGIHRNEISLNMKGFSEVVLLTHPGGNLGSACIPVISECARLNDCRFIILLTLPFAFEGDRRDAVIDMLPSVVDLADRTFIMDLQHCGAGSMVLSDALKAVDDLFYAAARTVTGLIGSIPFMSTFTDNVYTFSRSTSETLHDSLEECVSSPLYNVSNVTSWKMVICADGPVDDIARDALVTQAVNRFGVLPQVVPGKDEGKGLTVFIPIFLQI